MNIREDHLTNLPLHHIRAWFCKFWTKIKYLGNATHPYNGKIRYFADSKSTYLIFKYILSSIWGLSLKENILVHNLFLSVIIHPQKHPKIKESVGCAHKHKSWQHHNTIQKGKDRSWFLFIYMAIPSGQSSCRWCSSFWWFGLHFLSSSLIFLHITYTALCCSSSTRAYWPVWLWLMFGSDSTENTHLENWKGKDKKLKAFLTPVGPL